MSYLCCILPMEDKYVCVLVLLEDKAGVDILISFCIYPKSTWPQCIPQFDHFPTEVENSAFALDDELHYKLDIFFSWCHNEWSQSWDSLFLSWIWHVENRSGVFFDLVHPWYQGLRTWNRWQVEPCRRLLLRHLYREKAIYLVWFWAII